jgi:hypothetical protein
MVIAHLFPNGFWVERLVFRLNDKFQALLKMV